MLLKITDNSFTVFELIIGMKTTRVKYMYLIRVLLKNTGQASYRIRSELVRDWQFQLVSESLRRYPYESKFTEQRVFS